MSDDPQEALAGIRPTVLELLRDIKDQLAGDLLNHGACHVTRDEDGNLTRLDPTAVVLQAPGDVMPELKQQAEPDYLERMHEAGLYPDEDR